MKKRFGELLKESWKEYKGNFRVFLIIFLIFFALPRLLTSFFKIPSTYKELITFLSTANGIWILISMIIVSIIGLFASTSFIYSSLHGKNLSLKQTLSGGKKYFLKYFFFYTVHGIFLLLLYLLLIIPGIVFHVFWIFAAYILIEKNQGIIKSLKESYHIIRGKWWEIFGYVFLFILTFVVINIGFLFVSSLINFAIIRSFMSTGSVSLWQILLQTADASLPNYLITTSNLVNTIIGLGAKLITLPMGIIFFKNIYLEYKK